MKGLPNQDVENIDSNRGSPTNGGFNNDGEDNVPASTKDSSMSRKPRGPTNPTIVLDSSCKKKIQFNGRGQPIGENSVSLSTELGNIAKEMVPLNYHDWRKIPKHHKDFYWLTIQGQCVAIGQYTQLLVGFTPTSTNPSPTNFPVSSPTSSAPNIANPVASIPHGQCVAIGQYTQLLVGFTPTSTNPSPTNFPVSSPTSSAPNIANPVASIPHVCGH
ncbi:hypothetical protein FRX31_005934 [Thalictrum thalictroides]|uniref:Uncharacterized protein n=1 Tax=Thalictrum thalictroides TaxID=46969 RepID=A0A7J6X6I9_THATH|nr:hypothetical protein FRX31_005934 [Thalictrum thalictroides]